MKIKTSLAILALTLSLSSFAQFFDSVPYRGAFGIKGSPKGAVSGYNPDPTNTSDDWTKPWANFAPNSVAYPGDAGYNSSNSQFYTIGGTAQKVTISNDITSDVTLTNDKWYELSGIIHVTNGATLTIQAGTCLRGSTTNLGGLIIVRGAKIQAIGDKNHPIVITSPKAVNSRVRGDWAGFLVLGYSTCNTPSGTRRFEALPNDPLAEYGGGLNPNPADNSGTIRYMRVEFAGYNYLPDQEINGITFGAVGSGTHFDYIQSSFANDDAFEWFGGTVNHKYLIAFSGTDDDFDMDEGFSGKLQYLLGLRNAGLTETSPTGSCNGLEHDNNTDLGTPKAVNPSITGPTPVTTPIISNMTLVGPEHPGAVKTSLSTLWQQRGGQAFQLRTNDATSIFNSIAWGYPTAFSLSNPGAQFSPSVHTRAADDELTIRNTAIISSGSPDVKFNSSNFPSTGYASGASPWTSINDMKNWFMNGPTVSVFGYTGVTGNDSSRTTITTADITQPDYSGVSNGSLGQLDYTGCDFTLTPASTLYGTSSFQHPKIAVIATPSIAVTPSSLPAFNLVIGQTLPVKWVVVSASSLTANILMNAPTGFEIKLNAAGSWAASATKNGPSANDTLYIRFNKASSGSSNGYLTITSTKASPEFAAINIALSGTAISPAPAFINVSSKSMSFTNAVGSPSVNSFVVSGKNLTATVVITAPANFEISNNASTGFAATLTLNSPVTANLTSTNVYVRYNPSLAGSHSGNLTVTSTNADPFTITLSGNSASLITVSTATSGTSAPTYPLMNIIAGTPSLALPVNIVGVRLTDTLKVNFINGTGAALSNFQMSTDSAFTTPLTSMYFLPTSGNLSTKIWIRYNAAAVGTGSGSLVVTSSDAPATYTGPFKQLVAISGRASTAGTKYIQLLTPTYQLKFSSVLGTASAPQLISVSGVNLGTDSVVVTAPQNWDLSLNGISYSSVLYIANTGGTVSQTPVFVRYNPTTPQALNQFVIVSSTNDASGNKLTPAAIAGSTATNVTTLVFGIASPTVSSDLTTLPTFYTTTGKPSYANTLTVSGVSLSNDVVVNATGGFEISKDSISFSNSINIIPNLITGVATATKVYVRYNSINSGMVSGNFVSITTVNGISIPVQLSAVAVLPATPIISLSTGAITFNTNVSGATAGKSFTVDAQNLQDSLTITVASDYEVSTDSINYKKSFKVAGDANGTITAKKLFARFNRTSSGSSADTIFFTSTGLTTQKIVVSGTNNVGINQVNIMRGFNMYPNPAQQNITVDFILDNKSDVTIQIIDITGRIVLENNFENLIEGRNSVNMNISEIKNGFYFIKTESINSSVTSRLLISK